MPRSCYGSATPSSDLQRFPQPRGERHRGMCGAPAPASEPSTDGFAPDGQQHTRFASVTLPKVE